MPSGCSPSRPSSGPGALAPTGGCTSCAASRGATPCPPPDPWLVRILTHMCPDDSAFLDDLRTRGITVTSYDRIYFDDPYFDGTRWTTRRFEAGGSTSGNRINMISSGNSLHDASTLYHEGIHTGQPASMPWREQEYGAYIAEDQWRARHGLGPSQPGFRTTDSAGRPVTDAVAVRRFVDQEYPGVTSAASSGSAPEQVIGRTPAGQTIVQRGDGTAYTRAPRAGDSYAGPQVTQPPGGRTALPCQLHC